MSRKIMAAILAHREVAPLLSDDHFSVDGTLVKAWASMKSFHLDRRIGKTFGPDRVRRFGNGTPRRPFGRNGGKGQFGKTGIGQAVLQAGARISDEEGVVHEWPAICGSGKL